jgi:PAS domain S-box-containing protein
MNECERSTTQLREELAASRQRVKELEAEASLRENDIGFRHIAAVAHDAILMMDSAGSISFWNNAARTIFGYSAEEVLGKNLHELLAAPQYQASHRAAMPQFCRNGSGNAIGKTLPLHGIRKNGEQFPLELSLSAVNISGTWSAVGIVRDTSERHRAEQTLRESERRLSTLLGNLRGMAYRCKNDPQWTMEFVSQGCENLTGYPAVDLIGNRAAAFGDLIHPDDRAMVAERVSEAIARGLPFLMEYRIRTASGEEKWVWEQGIGVFSEDDVLVAVEGYITDISERQRAERLLRESEEHYRSLVENISLGILLVDKDFRILAMNRADAKLVGRTPEECVGQKCFSIFE